MESWWQSWGELIARRLALRWRSLLETRNARATPPSEEVGSEPRGTEDGGPKSPSPDGSQM